MLRSQKEQKELVEFTKKITEYAMAMRIELERKRLASSGDQSEETKVRMVELSCYMTLCGMEVAHKFLAYKNAMNATYKLENHITAAHFARQVLDLEPTGIFAQKPDVIPQFKKYY